MPPEVYQQAKRLSLSHVTGSNMQPNAHGRLVPRSSYQWGDRLPEGLAPKMKPHHATDWFAGMVRMNTSTGNAKSSAYLTMRTMTEDSTGWIIKATPGLFIVQGVIRQIESEMPSILAKTMKDLHLG
jgi:hypothetical protein